MNNNYELKIKINSLLKMYDENIVFDWRKHLYTYKGVRCKSVHSFLSDTGYKNPIKSNINGKKGTLIHSMIASIEKGKVDNKYFNGHQYYPYIKAYNSFRYDYPYENIGVEKRIASIKYLIAGTIDSLYINNNEIIIVDWKSGKKTKGDKYQLACYKHILQEELKGIKIKTVIVYICEDASYLIDDSEDYDDTYICQTLENKMINRVDRMRLLGGY